MATKTVLETEIGHTKGPWIFDKENVGMSSHAGYGIYNDCFEFGHEIVHVLCSAATERKLGEGVPEANARLVAASPELLEALENLIEAIPSQNNDRDWWPDELTRAVAEARAVIAKVVTNGN